MQPIVRYLSRALAFVAGVAPASPWRCDRLWRSAMRERRAVAPVEMAAPPPRLAPGCEWEMVVGVLKRDLARVPAIAAIQAHAALKIDAAEHALGRIIADCAKVLGTPLVPAVAPARRLAHQPEPRIREQLAA